MRWMQKAPWYEGRMLRFVVVWTQMKLVILVIDV